MKLFNVDFINVMFRDTPSTVTFWNSPGCFFVIVLTSHFEFYLTTRKMNHLSKREQKEFIHFAERENGRIKSNEK